MNRIRTAIFTFYFVAATLVIALIVSPTLLIGGAAARGAIRLWSRTMLCGLKTICGLGYRIEGAEHIPKGGAILAANHQSMWETIAFFSIVPNAAIVFKRELGRVPVYGWWARRSGSIPVDRAAGAKAIRELTKAAAARLDEGRVLIVFPEGTRAPVGRPARLQPGVAAIYGATGAPCLTAVHDSGRFWRFPGRLGSLKTPGTITLRFEPPVAAGLERRAFLAELERRFTRDSEGPPESRSPIADPQSPIPRPVAIVAAAALLLFAGYALLWRAGAAEMRRSIEDWTAEQRAAGVEVSYARVSVVGFPMKLRGVAHDVAIAEPGLWRWRARALRIDASPFAPNALVFSTDNSQRLDLGAFGAWRIDAPDGRARLEGGKRWRIDISSGPSLIERADGRAVASERFRLVIEAHPQDPDGLLIRTLQLEGAGAALTLSGAVFLDEAGYPRGALQASLTNPGAIATLLGEFGALAPEKAEQAAASLTLAAIASGGRLAAPLIFENGSASIAGVEIAKLPRVGP
ncbi:MAG: DUF2125 domain-containing protein [Amphiplicatus sp.]